LATTLTLPAPLPPPPPLTNVDPSKIDEIRRTVYVGNLDTTVRVQKFKAVVFIESYSLGPCPILNYFSASKKKRMTVNLKIAQKYDARGRK